MKKENKNELPVLNLQAPKPVKVLAADKAKVVVYQTEEEMGLSTAINISSRQIELVEKNGHTSMIVMAAPSAFSFYSAYIGLAKCSAKLQDAIRNTHFFQFDDYPLCNTHPVLFKFLLNKNLFFPLADYYDPKKIHLFKIDSSCSGADCKEYADLIMKFGPDLQIKGQGEDAHWGFHLPGIPLDAKPAFIEVKLNKMTIAQQMRDHPKLFAKASDVPAVGYTANVPLFMKTKVLIEDNVPQESKAFALVASFGNSNVDSLCPSGMMKKHHNAVCRTTQKAAWALLEYRNKGYLSKYDIKKLDEIWDTPGDPEVTGYKKKFMRDTFSKLKIKYEE
ncbi:MAG: hypothetical protein A2252_08310 [Elusimicrobia bacterium RIFOXYA2_FULL_39_19]|nr:MAG: hypothetical protein A2252_08310 [Elusimicrobia bacterium RIFOXYA2_FULL_39_19]